jgi:hypothetical protein
MTEQRSSALMCEALRLAKIEVKHRLRDQGFRLKDYEARELTELAEVWLKFHKAELIGQATIGLLCTNIRNDAQKQKAHSTGLSVVHKSRTKVEAER